MLNFATSKLGVGSPVDPLVENLMSIPEVCLVKKYDNYHLNIEVNVMRCRQYQVNPLLLVCLYN